MKTLRSLYIEVDLVEKIQDVAEKKHMSFNAAIEEVLMDYFTPSLDKQEKPKKKADTKSVSKEQKLVSAFVDKNGRMPNTHELLQIKEMAK